MDVSSESLSRKQEVTLFLFLAAVLIPGLTVGFVGAYGFFIWMLQAFVSGPPVS